MLDFEEARRRILQQTPRLASERVPLSEACGRVLARDVTAPRGLPEADTSAMDGYALSSADLPAGQPKRVAVSGESRAGAALDRLSPGTACRIFTGALLPQGADCVILQEDVTRDGEHIEFAEIPDAGQHVRAAGSDLAAGAIALGRGVRLDGYGVGVVAAMDVAEVEVSRRPQVSIICTGDELRAPGSPHRLGTIPESNGAALAALVRAAGAVAEVAPLVGDDPERTREEIAGVLGTADVLLTVGGVSVGDHDVVRDALVAAGASIEFWKVRIKPGKPLVFARCGKTLVLGLPGNPVSAQLTFSLFGLPLLRTLQGQRDVLPKASWGVLDAPLKQRPGRLGFHRVRVDGERVLALSNQSSGSTLSLADADALAIVPADSEGLPAGARVELLPLDRL